MDDDHDYPHVAANPQPSTSKASPSTPSFSIPPYQCGSETEDSEDSEGSVDDPLENIHISSSHEEEEPQDLELEG